jgi:hypothetical protein
MIAIVLIAQYLKKCFQNRKTTKNGEVCYARIIECVNTGAFVLSKEEFKVVAVVYVPSIRKRVITEEIVGYNNSERYPKNSYFSVLYYNGDINLLKMVNEKEISSVVLENLNEADVLKEYNEYIEIKEQERKEANEKITEKIEKIMPIVDRALLIRNIVIFYVITIVTLFLTSYLRYTIDLFKNFSNNLPWVIIYPLVAIISLISIVPLNLSSENSKKRLIFVLLWFFSMAFIILAPVSVFYN